MLCVSNNPLAKKDTHAAERFLSWSTRLMSAMHYAR